jgi:glutaminyl-tRNA synthetase
MAEQYGGYCNLRFDDTNPIRETIEYVEAIKKDVEWLGFEWENELYASEYFEQLYEWAVLLITKGKAYVCNMSVDEIA